MSKIMNLINYKKIIREDRERHEDKMNFVIDQLKSGKYTEEEREELAATAKGMLATNTVLEETNCRLEQSVGKVKGLVSAGVIGAVGYGVGTLIGHLITKKK